MSEPLVSIILPCYNHEEYVRECIESIIQQDYQNIELLIVDDGSSDNSAQVIRTLISVCENRFTRFEFRTQENKGLCRTLTEFVLWAKGEYFSVIASDDVILPKKISTLTTALETTGNKYAVVFGDATFIDHDGVTIYIDSTTKKRGVSSSEGTESFLMYFSQRRKIDLSNEFGDYKSLLSGNYLPAMAYVARMSVIKEQKLWTEGNRLEDWEMWLKLSKHYKFLHIDESVSKYRLHGSNSIDSARASLLLDGLTLLENEKDFAFKNGFKEQFYKGLIYSHLALVRQNLKYIHYPLKNIFTRSYLFYLFRIIFY